MKKSCAISTVIIGREFSLDPLLNYFEKVHIPPHIEPSLYIVLGCSQEFTKTLKDKISKLKLNKKYKKIQFVEGYQKCYNNLGWKEWEYHTRHNNKNQKHKAALYNIEMGLKASQNETYVHFIDDDTIPPNNALKDLINTHEKIDKCGLASGIYFNKKWNKSNILVGDYEHDRRICGSYKKEKWLGCCIDDLAIVNYQDIGFVGNGCMLILGQDIKKILPLSETRKNEDPTEPPDFIICNRIRKLDKKISLNPSVIAEHLDYNGEPVGLSLKYLDNIKNSTPGYNFLVMNYDVHQNYKHLNQRFDKVVVIKYNELDQYIPDYIHNLENIEIVEKSIIELCKKYPNSKNYLNPEEETVKGVIMDQAHKIAHYRTDYIIYYFDPVYNKYIKIPLLDSRNLKNFLNLKI